MNERIIVDANRGVVCLENDKLRLEFSSTDGRLLRASDATLARAYIEAPEGYAPFRLERDGGGLETGYESFQLSEENGGLALTWRLSGGVSIHASVSLEDAEARFRVHVDNKGESAIHCVEYPIFCGFQPITDNAERDYLAHSYATGLLVRNPAKAFENEGDGFRFQPYPECFSGCAMQFFAYYGERAGGVYFAALDGEGQTKWLNFYKGAHGLEASFIHGYQDIGPGKGIDVRYPVVLRPLSEGNWYEAAELYREWALRQSWAQPGPQAQRPATERADWLLKNVGLCTFGINASEDRARWIRKYHEFVDTPVFHVLGPDWAAGGQRFFGECLGGIDDWFPTQFSAQTIQAIQDVGDYYAPFEFDYLFNEHRSDGEVGGKCLQRIPQPTKSLDKYDFPFLCPSTEFTRELHVERDRRLAEETPLDAIYYDISCSNILNVCMDPAHGHPVGAGAALTKAQLRIYLDTKRAMREQRGRYVPMGTEMINEVYLPALDFYQARAGAEPCTDFEGYVFRKLFKTGEIALIPLFAYVYHEYLPVRMDGWIKLTEEAGELFYYTAARTYLWGGLAELNYEYSPMEAIDGHETDPDVHYFRFQPRGYALSERKGYYLRQFAKLRTGPANEYLAFGRMLRPLDLDVERVRLPWFHYNCSEQAEAFEDAGAHLVESVVHSAWRSPSGGTALFFANVTAIERAIQLDAGAYLPVHAKARLWRFEHEAGWRVASEWTRDDHLLTLPARTVAFIEIQEESK